jgi:hypothetical protein
VSRLPTPGGDDGDWGTILNDYLSQSINADGSLKGSSVATAGAETTTDKGVAGGYAPLDGTGKVPAANLPAAASGVTSVTAADATITVAGTASAPTLKVGAVPEAQVTNLTADLAAKAADASVVHLAGAETITGTKTFSAALSTPGLKVTTTPVSGYVLTSDASGNATWQAASGTGGSATLAGDSDVTIASPATSQVLTYNGTKWTNQTAPVASVAGRTGAITLTVADVSGVEQTTNKGVASGYAALGANSLVPTTQLGTGTADSSHFLRGDQTWGTVAGGSSTLAADTDVALASPSTGQVLTYDGTASKWKNQAAPTASNATSSAPGLIQLDGDLGGSATSPSVAKVNGVALPASAPSSAGQVLTATSGTATTWSTPAAGVTLDTTSADIQPLGTQAAGATGKAADASHVHAMPRLDQVATPTAAVALGTQKITGLASGTAATDAAAFGQIPVAGTTSGTYATGNDARITGAEQTANKGAASGYAPLNSSSQVPIANLPTGTTSSMVAIGNDARITGAAQSLVPTTVKTSAYTAAASDYVPVDISSGSVTVTLPTAPADKTRIGAKVVKVSGTVGSTTLTVAAGGADVFNIAGGSTSLTLNAKFQSVLLQYAASSAIWYVQTTDTPLNEALGAALVGTDGTVGGPGGTQLSSSVVSVNRVVNVNGRFVIGSGQYPGLISPQPQSFSPARTYQTKIFDGRTVAGQAGTNLRLRFDLLENDNGLAQMPNPFNIKASLLVFQAAYPTTLNGAKSTGASSVILTALPAVPGGFVAGALGVGANIVGQLLIDNEPVDIQSISSMTCTLRTGTTLGMAHANLAPVLPGVRYPLTFNGRRTARIDNPMGSLETDALGITIQPGDVVYAVVETFNDFGAQSTLAAATTVGATTVSITAVPSTFTSGWLYVDSEALDIASISGTGPYTAALRSGVTVQAVHANGATIGQVLPSVGTYWADQGEIAGAGDLVDSGLVCTNSAGSSTTTSAACSAGDAFFKTNGIPVGPKVTLDTTGTPEVVTIRALVSSSGGGAPYTCYVVGTLASNHLTAATVQSTIQVSGNFNPTALTADRVALPRKRALGAMTDSIGRGYAAVGIRSNWISLACQAAGFPFIHMGRGGDYLYQWASYPGAPLRRRSVARAEMAILALGANDAPGAGSAGMIAYATTILQGMTEMGCACAVATVTPHPSSVNSDGFTTTGNQTLVPVTNTAIQGFNTWVRAGSGGYAAFPCVDVAAVVESGGSASPTGLWIADTNPGPYTFDGLHPTAVGQTLMQAVLQTMLTNGTIA